MYKDIADENILVIGLGSMGKRRIRNLKALGLSNIYGFDLKTERKNEAKNLYNIKIIDQLNDSAINKFYAFFISVPPDIHYEYMKLAVDNNIHFFVEASVVDYGMNELIKSKKNKTLVAASSATLYFHPAIQKIYQIVKEEQLGKLSNFIYHSGQYLPDWHTYEKVSEYYVSRRETGGAREIVPFELTWITKLLGFPTYALGMVKKTIYIEGAENIDDTYNVLLDYDNFIVNLSVDVVSRAATRNLLINGDKKQLLWDWNNNFIKIYDPLSDKWDVVKFQMLDAQEGYNKNITEGMYINEMSNFLNATLGKETFFNTLEYDHKVLKLLYKIEESSEKKQFIKIE